jgi:hypothetical protein
MRDRASGEIDLRGMAARDRATVSPEDGSSGPSHSSGGGGPGSGRSETQRARELNGLLGEIFIFEQLRQSLPGFDSTCWVSENRSYYGHEDPGSDAEGHDFRYTDIQGILAQNEGTICEIEVKSSSSVEPTEFNLTQNEMNRARACHQDENRQYVILWVANVREDPALQDVLRDPIDLWERGLVDIRARGGRKVKVAPPKPDRSED